MNRVRLCALISAISLAVVGVVGVVRSYEEPKQTVNLSVGQSPADNDVKLQQPDVPIDEVKETTTTTVKLDVPDTTPTTKKPTTSTTAKPTTTTTPVDPDKAVVYATNHSAEPVKVWVGDVSEHEAILQPGQSIEWTVTQSDRNPDSGGAVADAPGKFCGAVWHDVSNLQGGHRYTLDVKASAGICPLGQTMPKMVLTDKGDGSQKVFMGEIPDAKHALIYVINKFTDIATVSVSDDTSHGWNNLFPGQWGEPAMMKTSTEHGDGANVLLLSAECGYGDSDDYFQGGRTYRIEVRNGQQCNNGVAGPNLLIVDLTKNTQRSLDPSMHYLPTTG